MDPTALMEAMTHHALGKQKKDDRQDDYKQELSNSERGWLSSCTGRRIQRSCHLALEAKTGRGREALHVVVNFQT